MEDEKDSSGKFWLAVAIVGAICAGAWQVHADELLLDSPPLEALTTPQFDPLPQIENLDAPKIVGYCGGTDCFTDNWCGWTSGWTSCKCIGANPWIMQPGFCSVTTYGPGGTQNEEVEQLAQVETQE